jgi:catechol 2,3-dioxygenase-like lactoylglutathione lyase family enzyme
MATPYPRTLTHVGLTVPDVEAAADWYESVLGFERVRDLVTVRPEEFEGETAADFLGEFAEMKQIQLAAGNGVGLELFEFDGTGERADPDPFAPGYFHVCVVDPDIEGLAARIADHGGEHYSAVRAVFDGQPYELTYCRDPWGNLVEVFSHAHEQVYSNQDAE